MSGCIYVAVCCSFLHSVAVMCIKQRSTPHSDAPLPLYRYMYECIYVVMCSSVLQCVVVCCSVLQCVAVVRSKQQLASHLAVHFCPCICMNVCMLQSYELCGSMFQCVAVCCSVL